MGGKWEEGLAAYYRRCRSWAREGFGPWEVVVCAHQYKSIHPQSREGGGWGVGEGVWVEGWGVWEEEASSTGV